MNVELSSTPQTTAAVKARLVRNYSAMGAVNTRGFFLILNILILFYETKGDFITIYAYHLNYLMNLTTTAYSVQYPAIDFRLSPSSFQK